MRKFAFHVAAWIFGAMFVLVILPLVVLFWISADDEGDESPRDGEEKSN